MDTDRFTQDDFVDSVSQKDVMDAIRGVRDELRTMINDAKTDISVSVGRSLDNQIDKKVISIVNDKMANPIRELKAEINSLKKHYSDTFDRLERVIKALPTPTVEVKVPEANINVNVPQQKAPEIIVNVPEQKPPTIEVRAAEQKAPVVNVNVPKADTPTVNVNVPKQEKPEVTVNVPEQKPPDIKIELPKRKVTKHITYDSQGRPESITETEE